MVNVGVKLRDKERNRGSFMALKKKPVTGMKDILPAEMQIRDYVLNQIKETYRGFGFSAIETPCVEHIENLCSKQGGDNEKLIFKILKRGEKLKIAEAKEESSLLRLFSFNALSCAVISESSPLITKESRAGRKGRGSC